ncbi:MAG: hypothetical protein R3F60_13230 [bacterium]
MNVGAGGSTGNQLAWLQQVVPFLTLIEDPQLASASAAGPLGRLIDLLEPRVAELEEQVRCSAP